MNKSKKIQQLLISHLLEEGYVELILPDGIVLEIGTVQEDKVGDLVKKDNYCWMIAPQAGRTASMDAYNLGLSFNADTNKFIFEDQAIGQNGEEQHILSVV